MSKINIFSTNDVLSDMGLPPMWPIVDEPNIAEFEAAIAKDEYGKKRGVTHEAQTAARIDKALQSQNVRLGGYYSNKIPTTHIVNGKKITLKNLWEDPTGYMRARSQTPAALYKASDKDKKERNEIRNKFMMDNGYVGLTEKIFPKGSYGGGSADTMLHGISTNSISNPISTEAMKYINVLTDPDKYIPKYLDAKTMFEKATWEEPKEWAQIHGAEPEDLLSTIDPDSRDAVHDFVLRLMADKKEFKNLRKMDKDSQATIQAIYNNETQSGEIIRDRIKSLLKRFDAEEVKEEINKEFPKAYIPENAIESKEVQLKKYYVDKDEREKNIADYMEKAGYYSPYDIIIGNKNTVEIMDGGRRSGDYFSDHANLRSQKDIDEDPSPR